MASVKNDIILTDEFKDALTLLEAKPPIQPLIFITGRAGTHRYRGAKRGRTRV